MLTICRFPDDLTFLRRIAPPIEEAEFGSQALYNFAEQLAETMDAFGGLVGLSATQVKETNRQPIDGSAVVYQEPAWRIFSMMVTDNEATTVCNPEILWLPPEKDWVMGPEGCASFASVQEHMKAPAMMKVRARTVSGEDYEATLHGVQARCFWHERRHLDGLLLSDSMKPLQKKMFLKKVAKAYKEMGR